MPTKIERVRLVISWVHWINLLAATTVSYVFSHRAQAKVLVDRFLIWHRAKLTPIKQNIEQRITKRRLTKRRFQNTYMSSTLKVETLLDDRLRWSLKSHLISFTFIYCTPTSCTLCWSSRDFNDLTCRSARTHWTNEWQCLLGAWIGASKDPGCKPTRSLRHAEGCHAYAS